MSEVPDARHIASRLAGSARPRSLDEAARLNRAIALTSLALGAAVGLILGLWSFDGPLPVPAWLGAYVDTPRRLVRLGHIAFFGLGILNLLLAREYAALALRDATIKTAFHCMNFGNVFLPCTLIAAAVYAPAKPFLAAPALSVFIALCLAALGAWRRLASTPDVPTGGGKQ